LGMLLCTRVYARLYHPPVVNVKAARPRIVAFKP
jgi:hypothetical protein